MKYYNRRWVAACLRLLAFRISAAVLYVDVNGSNSPPPYTGWANAATNIQDAVDAANPGDHILVTNGIYQVESRIDENNDTNRIAVTKPLIVSSVNGPAVTTIDGGGTVRCVYLTNGAALSGFTLTHGYSPDNGGGVWSKDTSATISNCVIVGSAAFAGGGAAYATLTGCILSNNTAFSGGGAKDCVLNNCTLTTNSAFEGGDGGGGGAVSSTLNNCVLTGNLSDYGAGAASCTLNNCLLSDNSSLGDGGGAQDCTLNNCTLTGNTAQGYGGGANGGTANNCIIFYNTASSGSSYANYSGGTYINFSCTTPLANSGASNITAEPHLTDSGHISAVS